MNETNHIADAHSIQFLLLPGLGADHRMAHNQLSLPYDFITPDYIPINSHESLEHYARRFGEHLFERGLIDTNRPLILAGYSFGSAVAQELSHTVRAHAIVLIGGLRSGAELKPFIRKFGSAISWMLPLVVYRIAEYCMPMVMRVVSKIRPSEILLAQTMYHDLPPGLFRAGYKALSDWRGCSVDVPVFRIHGRYDQIIICPKADDRTTIIDGAKHHVGSANPEIVNAAIERFVMRVLPHG